jgi:hypothetical protein
MPQIVKVINSEGVAEPALTSFLGDTTQRSRISESQKWRFAGQNALQQGSVGFLCGTVLSLVLFRSSPMRAAAAVGGAAFGLGSAYVDARYVFGHEVAADRMWLASVKRFG